MFKCSILYVSTQKNKSLCPAMDKYETEVCTNELWNDKLNYGKKELPMFKIVVITFLFHVTSNSWNYEAIIDNIITKHKYYSSHKSFSWKNWIFFKNEGFYQVETSSLIYGPPS